MEELDQHQRRKCHRARERHVVMHDGEGNTEHRQGRRRHHRALHTDRDESLTIQKRRLRVTGWALHHIGIFGIDGQGQRGKSVGDQVDPEN